MDANMTIQSTEVIRDEDGFWTHPHLPEWDEGTKKEQIDAWFSNNGVGYQISYMEYDEDELSEQWADGDLTNCKAWNPTCDKPGSFLLSIHDTEDHGPIALFAIPKGDNK